jgi:protein O-mannosyl-transferase
LPKPGVESRHALKTTDRWLRSDISLAVLALLAYANSFHAGFVFDNRAVILEDARLRSFDWSHLNLILNRPYWWPIAQTPLYRPLTTLSYLLNYAVIGNADRPPGYHIVNVMLHVANVWLLFGLVRRLTRRFWAAFFAAAVWAVHPIGTEAVTNIVGRADLLAALGVLGAVLAHLGARESSHREKWIWTAVSALAVAIGIFSKESAVAGVGLIVLVDLLWRRGSTLAGLTTAWLTVTAPVVAFLIQRALVLSQASAAPIPLVDNPIAGAGFFAGRMTALAVMGKYLALLFPGRWSADYSFAQIPLASGTLADWIGWIAVGAVTVAALVALKANRDLFFFLAAAVVCFLPVANLLFVTGTIMADRLMYLPSAFLIAGIVTALYMAGDRRQRAWLAPALLAPAIALCAAVTWARNDAWRDDLHLWQAAVTTAPNSFKAHDSLAEALYEADPTHANLDRVIEEKEKSLAILATLPASDQPPRVYRAAASYYLERGDWLASRHAAAADVTHAYQRAAELGEKYVALVAAHPVSVEDTSQARLLVSTAYAHLQNGGQAVDAARRGAADQPFNPLAYRALSAALVAARQPHEAAVELMTGFIVTGNADLRRVLIDLYRGGLDPAGCATAVAGSTVVLSTSCEIVRRHLCEAAARAAEIQRRTGRPELAAQLAVVTKDANCGTP